MRMAAAALLLFHQLGHHRIAPFAPLRLTENVSFGSTVVSPLTSTGVCGMAPRPTAQGKLLPLYVSRSRRS